MVAERALEEARSHADRAVLGGPAFADLATGAAGLRPRARGRQHDAGQPPRHQAAARHPRRDAEGRRRRPVGGCRLRRTPGRNRRAGRRARHLQAAGGRKGADRAAGARAQCRRVEPPAGDRRLYRRIRGPGAPDAEPARRSLQRDAHHVGRHGAGLQPDQCQRAGRRQGLGRGLGRTCRAWPRRRRN